VSAQSRTAVEREQLVVSGSKEHNLDTETTIVLETRTELSGAGKSNY
jgi:hypothetical protein